MKFGFLAGLAFACLAAGLVRADEVENKRVALVIGNADYGSEMGALANPKNDAVLIGDSLRKVGFDVVVVEDVDQTGLKRAISEFGSRLMAAGAHTTSY